MLALRHRFEATDKRHRIEAEQRRRREALRNRQAREKREEMEDRAEEALSALASAVMFSTPAPPERIADFEATLTSYDVAVIKALMRNDALMDLVNADIDAMLGRAHVLEDGRRVFRTEDGTQVFDEFGAEVSEDVILPDLIDPAAPTWEAFSAKLAERDALVQERQDILEHQEKLDAARVEIEDGEISLDELEAMEADLMESMPPTVAVHVEGFEPNQADAALAAATPPASGPEIAKTSTALQTPTVPYPDVGIAEARRKCAESKDFLDQGIDPSTQKKLDRIHTEQAIHTTFQSVAKEYLDMAYERELADATMRKKLWHIETPRRYTNVPSQTSHRQKFLTF